MQNILHVMSGRKRQSNKGMTEMSHHLRFTGLFALALLTSILWKAAPAHAHEYYLLPSDFNANTGTEFTVDHLLGQRFKGSAMPYIGRWNLRSEIWENGAMRPAKGRDGDRPALKITSPSNKLYSVIHQSNVDFLTFKTWEKFRSYVVKNGMSHTLAASENGTKPKIDLKEAYSRFAKTLITPNGTPDGIDTPTGLKIELVALQNPMALGPREPMPVQLLFDGAPLPGTLVRVFAGIDTAPAYNITTDSNGKALIPDRGRGPYLLNAIHMTDPQSKGPGMETTHWESFWASLTYQRAQ